MQLIPAAGRLNVWQPMLPSLDARQSSEQVGRHGAFSSWSTNWRSRASKSSLTFSAAAAPHCFAARPSLDGCNALPIAKTLCSLQELSLLVGYPCMPLWVGGLLAQLFSLLTSPATYNACFRSEAGGKLIVEPYQSWRAPALSESQEMAAAQQAAKEAGRQLSSGPPIRSDPPTA